MWTDSLIAVVVVDIHLPVRPLDFIPVNTRSAFGRFSYYSETMTLNLHLGEQVFQRPL